MGILPVCEDLPDTTEMCIGRCIHVDACSSPPLPISPPSPPKCLERVEYQPLKCGVHLDILCWLCRLLSRGSSDDQGAVCLGSAERVRVYTGTL